MKMLKEISWSFKKSTLSLLTILLIITGVGFFVASDKIVKTNQPKEVLSSQTKNASPTATPTPTPTPNIPTPVVIYKESTPIPTSIPTGASIPTQVTKIDSATRIELCKTKAETHKTQTMTALVLVYNQNNANAIKIANTSSVDELVNVGISIGLLTREQYNSDPSGHQLALLKTREKVMAEIKSYMDTVNAKGDMAYNDYYARCLNGEI